MGADWVAIVEKLGFGAVGFYFVYLLLKFLMGRVSTGIDHLVTKMSEEHERFVEHSNHISDSLKEVLESLKKLNGK